MKIAILLYQGVTALDAVGPYEVLCRLPGVTVHFVAKQIEPILTDSGMLRLMPELTLEELPDPDILLIPGAAGLLNGLEATTHWAASRFLPLFGARYAPEWVVKQGKVITGAGVSAGIDMALSLAAEVAGRESAEVIQLVIEYDPQPPFDAGSPQKASERAVKQAKRALAGR